MNDKIQTILTAAKSIGGALLVAVCVAWLWFAPDSAPEQGGVLAAFNVLIEKIGAVVGIVLGAWGAAKALKDALFTRQEQIIIEKRIQLMELGRATEALQLQKKQLELGMEGSLDVGP